MTTVGTKEEVLHLPVKSDDENKADVTGEDIAAEVPEEDGDGNESKFILDYYKFPN